MCWYLTLFHVNSRVKVSQWVIVFTTSIVNYIFAENLRQKGKLFQLWLTVPLFNCVWLNDLYDCLYVIG